MKTRPSFPPRPRRRTFGAIGLAIAISAVACALVVGSIVAGDLPARPGSDLASASTAVPSSTSPAAPAALVGGARGAARGAPAHARVGIRTFIAPADIRVEADQRYGTAPDGTPLRLDVCTARTAEHRARPAVLAIHGGSWTAGDKADIDWRDACQWLASEGFVAFSADYTLVPKAVYPTALDELRHAVAWLREPTTVARYGIDPRRIGVLGGSAGGTLAAMVGLDGTGDLHRGTRVAAVAELSGPTDLTASGTRLGSNGAWLRHIELDYLGCRSTLDCPQSRDASPVFQVDRSDPPVFIGASVHDLVPASQGEELAGALRRAGVPCTLRIVPGHEHSVGTLDAGMRRAVAAFLYEHLG